MITEDMQEPVVKPEELFDFVHNHDFDNDGYDYDEEEREIIAELKSMSRDDFKIVRSTIIYK
ncbi:MAG: hypothetical protein IJP48_10225 [Synergistaceae bacterium]|nr:hypothetical protein [Synergistaceae bacterium]